MRSVYLLVLNGRNGSADADAEYWLKVIESFAPGVPIVVALNQIERDPFGFDETAAQPAMPTSGQSMRTDCARRVRSDRAAARARERDPPAARPAGAVPRQLDPDQRPALGDGRSICSPSTGSAVALLELGEGDHADQERLATYLHCLGIAI